MVGGGGTESMAHPQQHTPSELKLYHGRGTHTARQQDAIVFATSGGPFTEGLILGQIQYGTGRHYVLGDTAGMDSTFGYSPRCMDTGEATLG